MESFLKSISILMNQSLEKSYEKNLQVLKRFKSVRAVTLASIISSVSIGLFLEYIFCFIEGTTPSYKYTALFSFLISGSVSFLGARFLYSYYQIIIKQQVEIIEKNQLIQEQKQAQLSNYVRVLAQKNHLIDELSEELKSLNLQNESKNSDKIEKISILIESRLLSDEDWREFKRIFDQVHTGFFVRLKENFPDLTPAEIRLFALIKLNLSTKEVAEILAVSPKSVNVARYRLRKSLGLEKGTDVTDFILNF